MLVALKGCLERPQCISQLFVTEERVQSISQTGDQVFDSSGNREKVAKQVVASQNSYRRNSFLKRSGLVMALLETVKLTAIDKCTRYGAWVVEMNFFQ
jgi:hypothetical protein